MTQSGVATANAQGLVTRVATSMARATGIIGVLAVSCGAWAWRHLARVADVIGCGAPRRRLAGGRHQESGAARGGSTAQSATSPSEAAAASGGVVRIVCCIAQLPRLRDQPSQPYRETPDTPFSSTRPSN
jgi:hypothetical protein